MVRPGDAAYREPMKSSFHVSEVSRGQAYAMLGGAALMMTLAMGMRQNLGLFQAPAAKELGIAISDYALAISVQQVAWGLSQPFIGILADLTSTELALIVTAGVVLVMWATGIATGRPKLLDQLDDKHQAPELVSKATAQVPALWNHR